MKMLHTLVALAAALACASAASPAQTPPAVLGAFANAWNSVQSYHTHIQCYSVKGSESRTSAFDYTFTKPASISMTVTSGPGAGNTVTWSGGNSVTAGRGMFKKSFALTDPAVSSLRGATVVDLSFGAILKHAQETQGTASAPSTTLDGAPADLVTLDVAAPAANGGVSREALYLSPATHLPIRVDSYAGTQLVNSCTFAKTATS